MHSREKWQSVLEDWQLSGLSASDYCRQKKIPLSSFSTWKVKLTGDVGKRRGLPRQLKASPFVELVTSPEVKEAPSRVVRITTAGGCVIEVPL